MEKKLTLRPFSRLEGDLEIEVRFKKEEIVDCCCSGIMFRGFENLLTGRDLMDALVFVCRICGVCGVSQSVAAAKALRKIFGIDIPVNGYLATGIVLATEILLNQFTHFYILFTPDLVNPRYSGHPLYPEVVKRFSPFSGLSYRKMVEARKALLTIMGIFAGKWPNTLALHPGGTTKPINKSEKIRCMGSLKEFQDFVESVFLGCEIEQWLEKRSFEEIELWLKKKEAVESDLGIFLLFGREIGLPELGKGPVRFLSSAGFELPEGKSWYKEGFYDGNLHPLDTGKIREDHTFSWLENGEHHPFEGSTRPDIDKKTAYSWSKSPRYEGKVVEVGPLARLVINQEPLVTSLFSRWGANVYTRVLARMQEAIKLIPRISFWIEQIDWEKPFYHKPDKVVNKKARALVEAARGMLGHWIKVENGKIKNYQIITPTTWNFSPRDSDGNPGACEQALVGTRLKNPEQPLEIFHIIRSYDPCLFCSVHMIEVR